MEGVVKVKKKNNKIVSEVQRRNRKGWLFILPFVIGFLCFYLQPLAVSLYYSFCSFKLSTSGSGYEIPFVGLANYRRLFTKETEFWTSLGDTFLEMLYTVPIVIVFSLFIAIILNQKFHGRVLVRAIFFMPVVVTSGLVIGIINGDTLTAASTGVETTSTANIFETTGLIDILKGMNLPTDFIDGFSTVISAIFDTLWKCGVQILLFLSALQSVPPQLYEAAKIEGATAWESFWKVTLPNVAPIILVNIIYTVIDSLTDTSNALMKAIDSMAFARFDYSTACLEAWIFFIGLLTLVGLMFLIVFISQRYTARKSYAD